MKVHLMGIGGAGVSALARVLKARGDEVTGCDVKESDTTAELEDAGAWRDEELQIEAILAVEERRLVAPAREITCPVVEDATNLAFSL